MIIFVVLRVASKIDLASLTTRLFCDAVIKCFNFGVDSFESTLTAHTVLAGCGGLTGRYCLEELRDDDTAIIINSRTVLFATLVRAEDERQQALIPDRTAPHRVQRHSTQTGEEARMPVLQERRYRDDR